MTQHTVTMLPQVNAVRWKVRVPKATCVSNRHGVNRRDADAGNHAALTDIVQKGEDVSFGGVAGQMREAAEELLGRMIFSIQDFMLNSAKVGSFTAKEERKAHAKVASTACFSAWEVPWGHGFSVNDDGVFESVWVCTELTPICARHRDWWWGNHRAGRARRAWWACWSTWTLWARWSLWSVVTVGTRGAIFATRASWSRRTRGTGRHGRAQWHVMKGHVWANASSWG